MVFAVVPPPPSAQIAGNHGTQRMNSLLAAGISALPPAAGSRTGAATPSASFLAAGSAAAARVTAQPRMDSSDKALRDIEKAAGTAKASAAQPVFDDATELTVSFLGPAVPLPNSSYFSSYEIFLAEEQLSRHQSRLIKLVYEFLPYQPRLSDYGPNYPEVEKLRATRDPSCDESLLEARSSALNTGAWPQAPRAHLSPAESRSTLVCYRTTADDFRRARARPRR
jgi:hypothetical protein